MDLSLMLKLSVVPDLCRSISDLTPIDHVFFLIYIYNVCEGKHMASCVMVVPTVVPEFVDINK